MVGWLSITEEQERGSEGGIGAGAAGGGIYSISKIFIQFVKFFSFVKFPSQREIQNYSEDHLWHHGWLSTTAAQLKSTKLSLGWEHLVEVSAGNKAQCAFVGYLLLIIHCSCIKMKAELARELPVTSHIQWNFLNFIMKTMAAFLLHLQFKWNQPLFRSYSPKLPCSVIFNCTC